MSNCCGDYHYADCPIRTGSLNDWEAFDYPDDFLDNWEANDYPEPIDPEDCEHGDQDMQNNGEWICRGCEMVTSGTEFEPATVCNYTLTVYSENEYPKGKVIDSDTIVASKKNLKGFSGFDNLYFVKTEVDEWGVITIERLDYRGNENGEF